MDQATAIADVAHIIQLAVAPVFLLTGIAGLLSVLSTRLHRIVDRARDTERRIPRAHNDDQRQVLHGEASALWRRISMINWSIRLSVSSALMVCLVVMALFLGDLTSRDLRGAITFGFAGAMLLLIFSLVMLLVEVSVSTRQMRLGLQLSMEETATDSTAERDRS